MSRRVSRRPDVTERLWAALRGMEYETGASVREVISVTGAAGQTVRRYLREWGYGGYVDYRPGGRDVVQLKLDDPRPPLIVRDGSTAYLSHPSDPDTYWRISPNRIVPSRGVPEVERRSRSAERGALLAAGVTYPDEPDDPAPAASAGEALLEKSAPEPMPVPASWAPPPEALTAAARISSLYETALAIAASIEAQLMELLHEIRRAIPDPDQFDRFIVEHTPLRAIEARRMVETWDVARCQRDLRELATTRPREAMSLVRSFVDAGAEADAIASFTTDDAEVAAVLALPPRRRNARIREMVQRTRDADDGHHPADREEIRTLRAERDALAETVESLRTAPAALADDPGHRLQALIHDLWKLEHQMAECLSRMTALWDDLGDARPARAVAEAGRMVHVTTSLEASLDGIQHAALALSGDVDPDPS